MPIKPTTTPLAVMLYTNWSNQTDTYLQMHSKQILQCPCKMKLITVFSMVKFIFTISAYTEINYNAMVSHWRYWPYSSICGIQTCKKGSPKTNCNIEMPIQMPPLEDMTHASHRHSEGMYWNIISPVCFFIINFIIIL